MLNYTLYVLELQSKNYYSFEILGLDITQKLKYTFL